MVQVTVLFHNGKKEQFQIRLDTKSFLTWAMRLIKNNDIAEVTAQFENGILQLH